MPDWSFSNTSRCTGRSRRFAEEETHFHAMKDGQRRDIAVHRPTQSNTSVETPAFDLDFSDATGLHR
jgi:hypothetical protein